MTPELTEEEKSIIRSALAQAHFQGRAREIARELYYRLKPEVTSDKTKLDQ